MQKIALRLDQLRWPSMCCRCGSRKYDMVSHSENVVVWTVLSVTRYQKISLEIPVCGSCRNRSRYWFAAAIGAGALAWLVLERRPQADGLALFLMIGAVVAGIFGVRAKPLRILRLDEADGVLELGVYNRKFAAALGRGEGEKK